MFQKNCYKCNEVITYSSMSALNRSIKNNSLCKKCYKTRNKSTNLHNKICTKCRVEKPREEFWNDAHMPDGLKYHCTECMLMDEKRKECKRLSSKRNKKHIREYKQNYHERNKKDLYMLSLFQKVEKEDETKAYMKEYRINNKETIIKHKKKWVLKYPEHVKEVGRKIARKRRATKLAVNENYTAEHEAITLKAFNNKCFNCGSKKKLHIDHHRPLSKGNPLTISNAVVLCRSCNSSKGARNPEDFYTKDQLKALIKLDIK